MKILWGLGSLIWMILFIVHYSKGEAEYSYLALAISNMAMYEAVNNKESRRDTCAS